MRRLARFCPFCGALIEPGRRACSAHSDLPALDPNTARVVCSTSVSNNGTVLPWSTSSVHDELDALITAWPDFSRWPFRSRWLHDVQAVLEREFPYASSADRKLTARNIAPFPLALGPNVP